MKRGETLDNNMSKLEKLGIYATYVAALLTIIDLCMLPINKFLYYINIHFLINVF